MLCRHNLLYPDAFGRSYALDYALNNNPPADKDLYTSLILSDVPAITTRQLTAEKAIIWAGFSSDQVIDGVRFRVHTQIPSHHIIHVITPFEVMQMYDHDHILLLDELKKTACASNIELGLYGSTALALATGKPYIQPGSDIDIYIRKTKDSNLLLFYNTVLRLEKHFSTAIDCELEIECGYGIKLKELFSSQKTVLAKGLYDAKLLNISAII